MKKSSIIFTTLLLFGCDSSNEEAAETESTRIWNDQSQGFYFEAKGGHVGNGVSQDYFLDTLDSSVLTHLKSIKTTTDTGDSNCGGDRHFISLTIMDETGGSQTYNENQADGCWGDNSDRDNISRTDIETLMELIAVP